MKTLPRFFILGIFIPLTFVFAQEPDLDHKYKEAVGLYRQGQYEKARDIFKSIDGEIPYYKHVKRYLLKCDTQLNRWDSSDGYYAKAANQAREVMDVRAALLSHLEKEYPSARQQRENSRFLFTVPPQFLFNGDADELSHAGKGFMDILKDYASTFRLLNVTVVHEKSAASDEETARRNDRRAALLGAHIFRQWGLPPQNIRLRSRAGAEDLFRFHFETAKPMEDPTLTDLKGILVSVRPRLWDRSLSPTLPIDLTLIDPARVRRWTLRLLRLSDGVAVKEYSGTSDVWVSLSWDGRDETGRTASFGEYQAFLTAWGLGDVRHEDSVGFVMKGTLPAAAVKKSPSAKPVPETGSKQWAQVIPFAFNHSDIAGAGSLDLKRLASTLKAFPKERVLVEGYADRTEENPNRLPLQRAESVRDALTDAYGISADRFTLRARDPRNAVEGESLQKALVLFIEDTRP